jgi:hypothetical protein
MTRRPAIIAAAALAVFGLVTIAPTANALTTKTKQCVKEARARLKAQNLNDRNAARATYNSEFTSCFGPGADCASACLNDQAICQKPFNDAALAARDVCKANFDAALDDCRDPQEADPTQCASVARLVQFACNQDAAAGAAPGLQGCSSQFSECTAACASDR